ncbi:MAG TPA: hypothetical protein VFX60_05815 [Micromonospora sp.]|nr:hypothetical protein [Micromonospora sp.]
MLTAPGWLAAAGLVGAALIIGWPAGSWRAGRRRWRAITGRAGAVRWRPARPYLRLSPVRTVLVTAGLAAGAGAVVGGPVAAVAGGTYAGLAARGLVRHRTAAAAAAERTRRLDNLCALAADLRAGLSVPLIAASALEAPSSAPSAGPLPDAASAVPVDSPSASASAGSAVGAGSVGAAGVSSDRIAVLSRAAGRLAEQTGAPLAELLERIESDARGMERVLASATAQAAGARATAWLLAGLPLGGIALGHGIGVDPLHVLLHTPVGASCAIGAITLQCAGLAWTDRLVRGWRREV